MIEESVQSQKKEMSDKARIEAAEKEESLRKQR